MQRLVECVPNISEGRNPAVIEAVSRVVESVDGVRLLDVDPGKSTNRTVITFVGPPEVIGEAAFRLIQKRLNSLTCASTGVNTPAWARRMYAHSFR